MKRLKISQFAKLGRVTVKTLGHYEAKGCLLPIYVNENSHRFYCLSQLKQLSRIKELKGLGFSIIEISEVFNSDISEERFKDLLHQKYLKVRDDLSLCEDRRSALLEQLEERSKVQEKLDVDSKVLPRTNKSLFQLTCENNGELGEIVWTFVQLLKTSNRDKSFITSLIASCNEAFPELDQEKASAIINNLRLKIA